MEGFDLERDFIDYWDKVIRQWLSLDADVTGFKDEAKEQSTVIEAINKNCENKKGVPNSNYRLNTMHMPEPYWGDPRNCSIVLLDYNPAGGSDNCHTTIGFYNGNDMKLIKYVKNNSYNKFATIGPVFRKDLNEIGMSWFCAKKEKGGKGGYEGYYWWQSKREWLDHLVKSACGKNDTEGKLPFGLELCGWHSKKWSSNMKWIDSCRDIIDQRSIKPLFESLKLSSAKIAVCIGAKFNPNLLGEFFYDKDAKFEDVTKDYCLTMEEISKEINNDTIARQFEGLTYSVEFKDEHIQVIAKWKNNGKEEKPRNRYYRIYKITEDQESYFILNSYASGSNRHPGKHFWPFENVLLKTIR